MTLQTILDLHRPVSVRDLCAELERAGAVDPFEADGLLIFTHCGRFHTVAATPGDVLAMVAEMEAGQ
jgi:hypothetical protein